MTKTSTMMKVLLVASLFTLVLPNTVQAKTVTITSDKYWTVTDPNGLELGNAQNVCRFTGAPEGCPQGATLFGSPGWVAIPGANWIWKPNATGTSSAAANEQFTFKTPFGVCGSPQTASLSVAADNSTDVFINNSLILTTQDFSQATTVNIPAAKLAQGLNMIEVKVKNAANPPGCADQYQCNPAGVIVKLTVTDNLDPWPTCMSGNKTYQVGEFEDLACPPGQVGSSSRACVCILGSGIWWSATNSCMTPPVTCTGANNTSFGVNATEPVPCPTPKVGRAFRTCQANGQWSSSDFSGCALPTTGVGGMCLDKDKVEIATCPAGTTCSPRIISRKHAVPWWCVFVLWIPAECDAGENLQTAESFCL